MNSLKQRSSSPVEAWTITRRGEIIERVLACLWTGRSCLPFCEPFWLWLARRLLSGTVGTGTASGPGFLRSEPDCDFLRFSVFSWSTGLLIWETGGLGFTFLALFFLADAATNLFHVRADMRTEWRFKLFSVLPLAPCPASVFSSRIPPFLEVGEMESTVPIVRDDDQHPPACWNAMSLALCPVDCAGEVRLQSQRFSSIYDSPDHCTDGEEKKTCSWWIGEVTAPIKYVSLHHSCARSATPSASRCARSLYRARGMGRTWDV